jgi:hypothetical protein
MNETEIILNLWWVHDDAGFIHSLRIRPYVGVGTDDDKLAFLHQFANLDYPVARAFDVPARFHLEFEEDGELRRIPIAPLEVLNDLDSPIALWEDAIKAIEADLPAHTRLRIPNDPILCSTALLADEAGRLFSGRQTLRLSRDKGGMEIAEPTWAQIIHFTARRGWDPCSSIESILTCNDPVTEEDALAFAATGHAIVRDRMDNPGSRLQMRFDVLKFRELVAFAAAGGFQITRAA